MQMISDFSLVRITCAAHHSKSKTMEVHLFLKVAAGDTVLVCVSMEHKTWQNQDLNGLKF